MLRFRVLLSAVVIFSFCQAVAAQTTEVNEKASHPPDSHPKGEVVMINRFNPIYPPLARAANISGDVELKLEVRKDGTIQSTAVVSGHPMLVQAALDSAQRSQFECRGCEDAVTVESFIYSFQIVASPGWPCPETSGLRVTRSENHIMVTAEPALVHVDFSYTRARSAKCLYLWPCGTRWGGEDYYYYRVRSAKCLDLWNCGHRLREPFAGCKKLHRRLSY